MGNGGIPLANVLGCGIVLKTTGNHFTIHNQGYGQSADKETCRGP